MNKTYRIVWNDARQTYVVASEVATSRGKPASTVKRMATVLAGTMMAHQVFAAPAPDALPTGGQVVSGQATVFQSGSTMNIQQGSDKAILNWQSFNIGANAAVNFQQPGSGSVALNRVIGSDPSAIYGSLTSNGQVFLVNPNGVLFGQGARVDVGGLVASTLDIRNEDFLEGTYRFNRDGATGSVVNEGELYGKYIALLAPEVRNEGVIAAHQGTVALAAGDAVTLNITGNQLIDVVVDQASVDTLVENKHLVQADDGTVFMSSQSANALVGAVVNSGAVEAQGIVNDGGVVRLLASSSIEHSGSINVDGGTSGNGGKAILLASLFNPDSLTTVSGTISARGGSEAGDGGFVETSGTHLKIDDTARIDTQAPKGSTGQWLLDPDDFTVAASGGDITGAALGTLLDTNNVIIQTTSGGSTCTATSGSCGTGATAGNGDIFINDAVSWTGATTLGLDAYRNIEINASLSYDFDFASLNIGYGTGGSGKAVIAQGVDMSGAGYVFDVTNGQFSIVNTIDTSRPYYLGTVNSPIYVKPSSSSGVYGSTSILWDYYADAAGSTPINIVDPSGSVTWSVDPSTMTVSGGPYSLTYSSGLSSNYYSGFAAGDVVSWTVTPRAITLTATNQSKTYGDTLNLGSTAFSITSGSLAFSDTVTSATLASATGKDSDTSAAANTYANEITISSATGTGGFNDTNYNISYAAGDLTVNKATLTYKANAKSITEGDAIPSLDGTVTGFKNSESLATATTGSLLFSTTATASSPADSYAINGSGLSATNYNFVQAASNATALTINAAVNYDSIAQLIAVLLKQQDSKKRKYGGMSLADMQWTYDNFAKSRKTYGTDFFKRIKYGTRTGTAELYTMLSGLTKEHCPKCSFTEDAYKEWLSGGTGKASASLGDVWKLQYKAAVDKGVNINSKTIKDDLFVKAQTFKSMKSLGYTAKDFKAEGFDISQFIVLENSFKTVGTRKEKTGETDGLHKYTTYANIATYTTVGKLAFSDSELLAAGYTQSEIDQAKKQASETEYSYESQMSTETTKTLSLNGQVDALQSKKAGNNGSNAKQK